jgi:hypothetical protein
MRAVATISLALILASCASPPHCTAREWLSAAVVAKRSAFVEIKKKYLKDVELEALPEAARPGVVAWVDGEIARVQSKEQAGDELWYFREEKCPDCGWYREGFALVRGCNVIDEITLKDDM